MYKEIIAVSPGIRTKHKYTVWAENIYIYFFNVKPSGTYSNYFTLKG